jgi:hypothetical protein
MCAPVTSRDDGTALSEVGAQAIAFEREPDTLRPVTPVAGRGAADIDRDLDRFPTSAVYRTNLSA